MKIMYITRFFAPEPGAASVRATECVRHLSEFGHEVSVITGFPNYLSEKLSHGYRNRLIARECLYGTQIIRTLTLTDSRKNLLKRLANQAAFGVFAMVGGFCAQRCDVVVASSPPFTAAIAGLLLSKAKRAAFVLEIRDLYPGSAREFGIIGNPFILGALTRVEEFLYRKADAIICATQGLVDDLTARGIPGAKVTKVLNGVNINRFRADVDGRTVRSSLKLDGKKVIVYTGIFGRAHGLSVLLDAAKALREREEIAFVLVGDGVDKERLMRQKHKECLSNVIFVEPQLPERVPEYIACADIGFASLRQCELTKRSVPVKMFEYMSCTRPVILSGSGEAANLLRSADAGVSVEPNDSVSLTHAIREMCADPKLRKRYGENGRRFVERHLSRRELAKNVEQVLLKAVKHRESMQGEISWMKE